jgi:hypothetical protein
LEMKILLLALLSTHLLLNESQPARIGTPTIAEWEAHLNDNITF